MRAVDVIAKKRDGQALSQEEIEFFVNGFASGDIPDYQTAAWAMAVFICGMDEVETTALTLAMARSGRVLDLSSVGRTIADKHSSGGVGDKTTLVVAPWVASCGVPVGKLSGRGLSFGGGTIDKLEAVPGFRVDLSASEFLVQLAEHGIVVSGQSRDLAPADGKLYALRDVTATVDSVSLIASSIMSKKIAAGANVIVLDVKVGRGALMKTEADALALAELMVKIGRGSGMRVAAVIGDMNQPLGLAIGNSLEVIEAIETLKGRGPADLVEHCLTVAGQMLKLSGAVKDDSEARSKLQGALNSGQALAKFAEWIGAQGGDTRVLDEYGVLSTAKLVQEVKADRSGFIAGIDALALGLASVLLGAGREKKGDPIDHAVGLVLWHKVGEAVRAGETLCTIHANDPAKLEPAHAAVHGAIEIKDSPTEPLPLIHRIIS
jgi:pyrimidine-nucleoside phosphorylase